MIYHLSSIISYMFYFIYYCWNSIINTFLSKNYFLEISLCSNDFLELLTKLFILLPLKMFLLIYLCLQVTFWSWFFLRLGANPVFLSLIPNSYIISGIDRQPIRDSQYQLTGLSLPFPTFLISAFSYSGCVTKMRIGRS